MKQVTTILTVYKRDSLKDQLDRIKNQSIESDIIIWQNGSDVDIEQLAISEGAHLVHSVNHNYKYHGRFTLPLLLQTEYTVILDDDTLPNELWLEKCLSLSQEKNCIVGGNGRILTPKNPKDYQQNVDMPQRDHRVDFVGHAWFFKTDWIRYMWRDPVPTYDTAEDISFCASAFINGNIRSYVPDCSNEKEQGDSDKLKYGNDINAASNISHHKHHEARRRVIKHWISKGWKPMFTEEDGVK